MTYAVSILRRAQKELTAVSPPDFERVCAAIRELARDPHPAGSGKLVLRDGWRVRVGNYRVIYSIDDTARAVLILHIGHRRDVYR
ncbi:MAG: type II toxin-antitoxin system RelE/ParE family toxin [bacterium]